jgi:hypothetical protein
MRGILVGTTIAAVCLMSIQAFGQDGDTSSPPSPQPTVEPARPSREQKNAITTGPFSLIAGIIGIGNVNLEYERALSPSMSLFIAPDIQFAAISGVGSGTTTLFGIGTGAGVRLYPLSEVVGSAPRGFWVGPCLHLAYSSLTAQLAGAATSWAAMSAVTFSVGGQLGYTFLIANGFVLSFGGGVGAGVSSVSSGATSSAVPIAFGFDTRYLVRMNLGYAF